MDRKLWRSTSRDSFLYSIGWYTGRYHSYLVDVGVDGIGEYIGMDSSTDLIVTDVMRTSSAIKAKKKNKGKEKGKQKENEKKDGNGEAAKNADDPFVVLKGFDARTGALIMKWPSPEHAQQQVW